MKVGVSSQKPASSLADRPPAYGKFAMDEWIKAGNTQNVFIRACPCFQIPYFSKD